PQPEIRWESRAERTLPTEFRLETRPLPEIRWKSRAGRTLPTEFWGGMGGGARRGAAGWDGLVEPTGKRRQPLGEPRGCRTDRLVISRRTRRVPRAVRGLPRGRAWRRSPPCGTRSQPP